MNLQDYTEATRNSYGSDPNDYDKEQERCNRCDNDILTLEEIDEKMCIECMEELEIIDENTNFKNL
tara:strand:- start:67 stop:264 length:198 start_codon:yes stop_codon:yes gene_type:complete